MTSGWLKISKAAEYSGVSPRTIREWLKDGLRHSRPRGGAILISTKAIDEYLGRYEINETRVEQLVNETLSELKN